MALSMDRLPAVDPPVAPAPPRPSRAARPGPPRFARAPAYPGARLLRLSEAPARCPTCGGPWRRLAASLACLTCPTELYVAAELRRLEGGGPP